LAVISSVTIVTDKLITTDQVDATLLGMGLYKMPISGIILIMIVGGMAILINLIKEPLHILTGRTQSSLSEKCTSGIVLLSGIGMCLAYIMLLGFKITAITSGLNDGLNTEELRQIFGILLLMIAPFAVASFVAWLMHTRRCQFTMIIDPGSQKWIMSTLTGFLVMSLLLIALANPKGDIQDNFIQKVKFISSHALYALWIGYGLILGLASVDFLSGSFFRKKTSIHKAVVWSSLGVAALLPLVPIQQNASNKELLRTYGGAEQNGHDFGWQFGNYQLRGAEAIIEEVQSDEEPLPNPFFPPEMGPRAIFFGGTDPGRFVPTYMIYSAKVRPDVYLITQNALADGTYMSVMRDLYGNEIWIPAQPDSAKAFERYVREVQSGVRPANAQLKIENGRVQVSGALGVMEINGILAQMIFEHNNYKHDFYVEESYVIRWMYNYLTPHGLIMKINRNPTNLDRETITNDMDFWDWYTRRLVGNNKFIRDIVARKSFSKLRSAIAGLYANPGERKFAEAEQAFREARMLYPLSPEANFRMIHEVLIPLRRISEASEIMQEFGEADPGNTKVKEFLTHLDGLQKLNERIAQLEAVQKTNKMDVREAIELADCYLKSQQFVPFMNIMGSIVNTPNLPPGVYMNAANMLHHAGRNNEMSIALDKCMAALPTNSAPGMLLDIARLYAQAKLPNKVIEILELYIHRAPNDWRAHLDLAAVQIGTRQTDAAVKSAEQAMRFGGNEAMHIINTDHRFAPIRNIIAMRTRNLIGIGTMPIP
ncbi:MAG: hypothetical protein JXN60_08600, partial [Lentisphaerae bacterium]|nr:hypothetical protein [Lentisphaerota bacterium]